MFENSTLIDLENILKVNASDFENIALRVFNFQYARNPVYRQYCDALRLDVRTVISMDKVPFLPISFFKSHEVFIGDSQSIAARSQQIAASDLVFESSGTTGELTSRHYVRDASIYERSLLAGFEQFYGDPSQYAILALLPSYLERKNASLVHMAQVLMQHSAHPDNGFYINEWDQLHNLIMQLGKTGQKILLLGVTFALLDFAEAYPGAFRNIIVMETGGMKGRKKEMTRTEVHEFLKSKWHLHEIHSEYGMTELLSQAYSAADGIFRCTDTMRVLVRDINDPFDVSSTGSGCLNVIDLANVYSCSFIATEDLGNIAGDGSFEVLGRMDHSALRGCSLMAV